MEKYGIIFVVLIAGIKMSAAQNTTVPPTVIVQQNVTVSPNQSLNLSLLVPGRGILGGLASLLGNIGGLGNKGGEGFFGRCFGAAKKLKMLMPILLFKLGVIATTLAFLTLFSLKGLAIGVMLLILNAGGLFGKLALLKGGGGGGWMKEHYPHHQQAPPQVHLHVHKDPHGGYNIGPPTGGLSSFGPTAWSDRISQGLSETRNIAEKMELINMYRRLGFNVNSALRQPGNTAENTYSTSAPTPQVETFTPYYIRRPQAH